MATGQGGLSRRGREDPSQGQVRPAAGPRPAGRRPTRATAGSGHPICATPSAQGACGPRTHRARRRRSAEAPARPGPAAGRGVPGTRGGCSPSSPRLGSGRRGLRAAASDGRAQPLQWHRAGRGARVTAAGAPKPGPPRPARARRHRPRFPRIARLALKQNKEITQAAPGLEAAAVDPALPATQGHGSRRLSRGKNHSPAFHAR
jgi:hypothetical protein